MESKLSELGSVQECKVDFANKTATCKVSKGTDPKALIDALEGTKFKGSVQ